VTDMFDRIVIQPLGRKRRDYLYDGNVQVIFDGMTPKTDGVSAIIEVRWVGSAPPPQLLTNQRGDVLSSRTVPALVRAVEGTKAKLPPVPWHDLLTACCYDVYREFREGSPPVNPFDETRAPADEAPRQRWLIRGLVGASRATSLVGPGKSLKSYVANAAGLTVVTGTTRILGLKALHTGPVFYIDYEDDEPEFRERGQAICTGVDIPVPRSGVFWHQPAGPLYQSVDRLEQFIVREGIVMVIVDSVMLARGSGDNYASDTTLRFYEALYQLGVPSLLVDHQSWEAAAKGKAQPYGSVVNYNSLRLMWLVSKSEMPNGAAGIRLSMAASNHFRRQPDLAWEVQIRSDPATEATMAAEFRQLAAQKVSVLATDADSTAADRILYLLMHAGPDGLDTGEISAELSLSPGTVRGRLSNQLRGRVRKVGERRWVAVEMDGQDGLPNPFERRS